MEKKEVGEKSVKFSLVDVRRSGVRVNSSSLSLAVVSRRSRTKGMAGSLLVPIIERCSTDGVEAKRGRSTPF